MYINQTAACVVPSMNHCELTLSGCGWGVSVMWPSESGLFDCVLASPTENVQLRRFWPVQPFAPCGQHRLGCQCKCWRLVKLDEAVRRTSRTLPVTLNHLFSPCPLSSFPKSLLNSVFHFCHLLPLCPPFSCLTFLLLIRVKNRRLYTEKWSNPPLHLGSHWARRSSQSKRQWGNACRRSTAAPYLSRLDTHTLTHGCTFECLWKVQITLNIMKVSLVFKANEACVNIVKP